MHAEVCHGLSFSDLKLRTLGFRGTRPLSSRISPTPKHFRVDTQTGFGADNQTHRDKITLVLFEKNGLHASLGFVREDWDISKRVMVLTRFPEDDIRNLNVDFFTCNCSNGVWELNSTNSNDLTLLCLQVKAAFEDSLNSVPCGFDPESRPGTLPVNTVHEDPEAK